MSGFDGAVDGATWQALGLVLTLVGLGLSVLVWRRKGPARGLRAAAWSLVPLAAGLTGVLRLVWEIAGSVGSWAGRLVFSPVVWLGLAVAVVAAVLFVVSGWLLRRSPAAERREPGELPPAGDRPTGARPAAPSRQSEDMADVEEILRRHGIQ